jgi:hypothetical protein
MDRMNTVNARTLVVMFIIFSFGKRLMMIVRPDSV